MALLNWNQPYAPNLRTGYGGYYELGGKSGLVGPTFASGAILFACQFKPVATLGWTPRMQLKWLKINALTTTAFGAAQAVDLQLFKCRGFTAADSAGSALVPAAGDNKKQSGYSNSLFVGGGDIRIAATATLTAGTRTPEAIAQANVMHFWSGAIGAAPPSPTFFEFDEHHVPMTFVSGEGFEIQNGTAFGGTGVVQFWIDMGWMEENLDGTQGW